MTSKLILLRPIILAVCAGLLLAPRSSPALAQDPPLVLAFYYAWYDQDTWSSGLLADQPSQPYTSSDPTAIERHVSQAQAAGIDALIQSWYGPQETNNQTETNFRTLLDVAAARGFRVAVDFETTSPFLPNKASVADALHYLLTKHAQHPAYLHYHGKPVIFFWRQGRFSVDEWAAIRAQVDPDHDSLWIAEGVDITYQAVFDGHHLYSIAWSPDVAHTLADWGSRVRSAESQYGANRLWVASVMPGYDDTRTDRADAFAVDRRDGDYYRETWSAAIASQPDWIVITSFNEWVEGTMIEPSLTYGNRYLDLTRELATTFKAGGREPAPGDGELTAQDQGLGAEVTENGAPVVGPYVRANQAVRVRSGPGAEYPRLGNLWPGETAGVVGRNAASNWWQIEFVEADDGSGWVSAPVVDFSGDAASVPTVNEDATPVTSTPISSPTPRPTLAPTFSPTVGPAATSAFTPTPTITPAPTLSPTPGAPPLRRTFTPPPVNSPAVSATPMGTPMLRVTPVSPRRPVGLLWMGGGALALAFGLGGLLLRTIRTKR